MSKEYDVVIVGGGTGGYVAAIRASQLGLSTAIVEKNKLGGTCLHAGCIPSKALLKSAEVFQTAKHSEDYGILSTQVELDFSKVQQRKEQIVEKLYSGVQYLMNKGKIDVYEGTGRMLGPSIFSPMAGSISVEFTNGDENEVLIPKNVILATGSRPNTLPNLEVDGEKVITSDEALKMENLPTSIIIVGGGVIGVEWASMLCDFGVSVTIVEYSERILPTEDEDVSKEMHRALVSRGVEIVTGAEVLPETLQKEGPTLIEAVSHRLTAHSSDDDDKSYRAKEELESAKQDDPVVKFAAYLREEGLLTDEKEENLLKEIMDIINDATDYAEKAAYADGEHALKYVYGE
ncbi:FAD-dependent oxidoreductase [Priestia filamentosa]|nr:FAD-dependent oxidoreductase [Priestia filamentosa]